MTPNCMFCNEETDSAQHTIQICTAWEEERRKLKDQVGEDLSLRTLISRILENKEKWLAFPNFAETVMARKENKEREEEKRNRRTQDMDPG